LAIDSRSIRRQRRQLLKAAHRRASDSQVRLAICMFNFPEESLFELGGNLPGLEPLLRQFFEANSLRENETNIFN